MAGCPDKLLIVGLGSIGRRHVAVARELEPGMEIMALRRAGSACGDVVVFTSLDEALNARPDAVIIANPAPLHVATAQAFVEAGKHVLIEKPLSDRLDGIDKLLASSRRRGTVLQVGYCLRFHPSLIAMKQAVAEGRIGRILSLRAEVGHYLPDWRPGSDYRSAVSARRDLGGGVLLELSHEIDLARWLAGEV
ncbi:MAG TPA: Gfo/Idh/MocA family oxidoreductase, partial [Rhodospirillales bacterium]|nr:Gfo/Idh/MocA family oxidoreductase [Rhodospirillales bacterium]